MNNDSCILEVRKLEKNIFRFFNNKKLNSSECIAYLKKFNNKLESLYRDTLSYSELDFLNSINKMLEHIHLPNQPKHYEKFRTSLEIRLVKAWYNIIYHRKVNIYLSQIDDDVIELFYLKYVDGYFTDELVHMLWSKLCWFIITKNPKEDEYSNRFKLYFKSLSIDKYEKCYFYLSLLVNVAKATKINIHDLIVSRLERILDQFIIYQKEQYGEDTVKIISKEYNVINPLNDVSVSVLANNIKITKATKDSNDTDNTPVFLGNYVMKEPVLPNVKEDNSVVVGKNNKVVIVKYRRKNRKLEGNENV